MIFVYSTFIILTETEGDIAWLCWPSPEAATGVLVEHEGDIAWLCWPSPEAATGGLVEHEGITECLTPIIGSVLATVPITSSFSFLYLP